MFEVTDHPQAPDYGELEEYVLEPIPQSEIRDRRASGQELAEVNLLDHDDLNVYIELDNPNARGGTTDVGTILYRLTQLFGTPQLPEYQAGDDVSWRTDTTFKYLFRGGRLTEALSDAGSMEIEDEAIAIEAGTECLLTVFDWQVSLGVGLAEWGDPDADPPSVDAGIVVPLLALVRSVVREPVECEGGTRLY